jgi:proton glutamate symport protein
LEIDSTADLKEKNRRNIKITMTTLLALGAGLSIGMLIHGSPNESLKSVAGYAEAIGTLWSNALQMMVLPLIVSTLIYHFAAHGSSRFASKVSGLSILTFLVLLSGAAIFTVLLTPPILNRLTISQQVSSTAAAPESSSIKEDRTSAAKDFVDGVIAANPVKAAADGALLPLVVASILFAFALTRIKSELRQTLLPVLHAISETSLVLVGWVIKLMPYAVFAYAIAIAAKFGLKVSGMLGYFIIILCLLLLIFTLLLYPVAVLVGGVAMRRFAQAVAPAQGVAISSRSSIASLPALILGAERLQIAPAPITNLVLPISVSAFKNNRPISSVFTFLFLATAYNVPLTGSKITIFALTTLLLSFSSPGIPSGGKAVMLPAYIAAGIPVEGVILLKSVDAIPDLFKTVLNVTADMTALTIVARLSGLKSSAALTKMEELPSES